MTTYVRMLQLMKLLRSKAIVKFIEEHNKNAWYDKFKDTVKVSFKDKDICLSGIRVYVKDCMDLFQNLISSTSFDILRVSKPGGRKFFQEKESMCVEEVLRQTGCVVHLVEKDDQTVQAMEDTDQKGFGSHGKSLQQHNHPTFSTQNQHRRIQSRDGSDRVQTKEGLTIILMKGNIQEATVNYHYCALFLAFVSVVLVHSSFNLDSIKTGYTVSEITLWALKCHTLIIVIELNPQLI